MVTRRALMGSFLAVPALARGGEEWIPLFDGRSLSGWKASENPDSFRVRDGQIAAGGPRAHLFYSGPVRNADFKNFELRLDVRTRPGSNSGVYFHTRFQQKGWPAQGFEVQINNTYRGEGDYRERKKTGSLYGVRNVYKSMARDEEWFQLEIAVRGPQVQVRVNGTLLVDYVEADPPVQVDPAFARVLGRGTFALQGHDPGSLVFFRNIRVRPLPDDLPAPPRPAADAIYRELMRLGNANYPLVDFHVHLRPGMQLEDLLRQSRRDGIQYGIAVNGGVGQGVTDDAGAEAFLKRLEGQPVFRAFQAEGREWIKMFSKATLGKFDYLFTDAMTFTDEAGRRMRLWIPGEVGEIKDAERFMDMLVSRTLGVINDEPIDIYVNPTFLPEAIGAQYDRLWTPARRARLIEALRRNDVALEINNRYRLPSPVFIREARQAGVKFTFGTNNGGAGDLGRLEYGLEMVKECGLSWQDFWVPKPEGEKAIQRRSLA